MSDVMINEGKLIKKKFGEKMWHYCRSTFPSILETNGQLYKLLTSNFAPSHKLYENLVKTNQLTEFKNYILSMLDVKYEDEIDLDTLRSPSELLSEAGYTLYECHNEEEIQAFKRYYEPGEELCTFQGDRLEICHVFFAVRNDAESLRREDFKNPKRQDRYGTSVISIQFSKDDDHTLSIKNRYNHTVSNPDATYSNNLDNIVPGLSASFEKYYGLRQKYKQNLEEDMDLDGFVFAQGLLYRYFVEQNGIYYCEDNIIIDNGQVIEKYRDKGRYILCGALIFDKLNKQFVTYDKKIKEGLIDTARDVKEVELVENGDVKQIIFRYDGYDAVITLDDRNMVVGYDNPGIEVIGDYFLNNFPCLQFLNLPNARILGAFFFGENQIEHLYLPNVEEVGNSFSSKINGYTKSVDMPKLKVATTRFCCSLRNIESVNLPSLERTEEGFFGFENGLRSISLPNAKSLGPKALAGCKYLEEIYIPQVEEIENGFLYRNETLRVLNAPSLRRITGNILYKNGVIEAINAPMLEELPKKIRNDRVKRVLGMEVEEETVSVSMAV